MPVTPGRKGRKPVVGDPVRVLLTDVREAHVEVDLSGIGPVDDDEAGRDGPDRRAEMDIDMSTLRLLEREREISLDVLVSAIEQALLSAYHRTPGAQAARARGGRPQDRARHRVGARGRAVGEPDDEGIMPPPGPDGPEYDDTPDGFGRIATATARQVIVQRLRDAEDDQVLGAFRGKEGEVLGGVIQQGRDPRTVLVDVGGTEAVLPAHEQVPGEEYVHGDRIRGYVLEVARGQRGPQVTLSRTHPNLVRKLFALEVPEVADGTVEITAMAREAGHRTKMAVRATVPGVNAKGACIGPMGGRVRAVMAELHGEKIDIVDHSDDPAEMIAHALSPARVLSVDGRRPRGARRPRRRAGLPAVARDRQGGPERPPRREADRLAHRHPVRRRGARDRLRRARATVRTAVSDLTVTPSGPRRGRLTAAGPDVRLLPSSRRTPQTLNDVSGMGPVRTCVGCRATGPRSALLRVVVDRDDDPSRRGRRSPDAGQGGMAAPRS